MVRRAGVTATRYGNTVVTGFSPLLAIAITEG